MRTVYVEVERPSGHANGAAMSKRDDLLFGAEPVPAPDRDGDGVSDAQERLDGTDPNDPGSVAHGDPAVDASLVGSALVGDLGPATLEHQTVVDVVGATPAGFTADQALPTGLDGKSMASSPSHYGVGDDTLLAGRVGGGVDVSRDPTVVGQAADATVSSGALAGGGIHMAPPGETRSGSADPSTNMDLVAGKSEETAGSVATGAVSGGAATAAAAARPEPAASPPADPLANLNLPDLVKFSDPDAGGGPTVAPTAEQVSHAVTVHGGATDVVQGFERPQIEGDGPPKPPGDLVTDPVDPKGSANVVTSAPPPAAGLEISHTINPDAGFDLPPGAPDPGSGTGDGDGYATASSAATADTTAATSTETSSISVVGTGSTGSGIQSVADDATGVGSAVSLDPVADAMVTVDVDVASFQPPAESFSGLDVPDDLAVPDQAELDDGF